MKSINITSSSSPKTLREALQDEASRRGMPLSALVAAVYQWAVDNRREFRAPLKKPTVSGGQHIGAKVSEEVASKLDAWAKERGGPRGALCAFILQKVLEADLLPSIVDGE